MSAKVILVGHCSNATERLSQVQTYQDAKEEPWQAHRSERVQGACCCVCVRVHEQLCVQTSLWGHVCVFV